MGQKHRRENGLFSSWPTFITFCRPLFFPSSFVADDQHVPHFVTFLLPLSAFHRSGINRVWSVWRFWPGTQAQYCVCSMTTGSLSPGLLTQLSGTHQRLLAVYKMLRTKLQYLLTHQLDVFSISAYIQNKILLFQCLLCLVSLTLTTSLFLLHSKWNMTLHLHTLKRKNDFCFKNTVSVTQNPLSVFVAVWSVQINYHCSFYWHRHVSSSVSMFSKSRFLLC